MICSCCQLLQSRQYCAKCLNEGVATHQSLSRSLSIQCTAAVKRAQTMADDVGTWRRLRAEIAASEKKCDALRLEIAVRESQLRTVPQVNPSRRAKLISKPDTLATDLTEVVHRQSDIDNRIIHARGVLVREAIAVFGVQEDEIARLKLPPPGHFRQHSSATLNAALSHTVHLLSLLTSYLSLTLPYIPTYPTLPHVGRPSLRANTPLVATTKFRDKHILWMSSKTTPSKLIQFLTSYALLCHSVAYLAWTQGVEGIGIQDVEVKTPATSLLALLFATARSSRLGIRSHESGSLNHLGFGLDVSNVVSAVLDADGSWEESEWDMVER